MNKCLRLAVTAACCACYLAAAEVWITEGFEAFRKGAFGNSGQNLYVSRAGILQRIHHSDINHDGEVDLLFCNSQEHEEYVHPVAYQDVLRSPGLQCELRIGGVSSAIAVGDLNGDGFDEVVFACGWNGSSWIPNNMIFYGSPEGIGNRYQHYLTCTGGRPVIGDFNGDKLPDVIFVFGNADKGKMTLFSNTSQGMPSEGQDIEFANPALKMKGNYIAGVIAVPDSGGDAVVYRMTNGGLNIFRNRTGKLETAPEVLLPPDPDYREVKNLLANNQFVPNPKPLLRAVELNGKLYIFGARENSSALYPYADGKLDLAHALTFRIHNALAVSAGKVRNGQLTDLVFAAKDSCRGQECSWYYPAAEDRSYPEKDRTAIPTCRANDMVLADLGGKALSLIVMQSNMITNYNGSTLLYKEFTGPESLQTPPAKLPCGDARRILTPRMRGRRQLVLPHTRSGNATSRLPVVIYTGKNGGYDPARKIELMANGAMDGVFADVDADGYPDVILANEVEMAPHLNDGSYLYFNGPDGFAKKPLKLPTRFATGVVVADFNQDGHLDIIFSALADELTMYCGQGGHQFKRCDIKLGKDCQTLWIATADLNYDGWLDLVVPTSAGKSCILWGGKEGFDYRRRQDFNIPRSQNAKVADLNRDGYLDLLFCGVYPSIGKPHDCYVTIFYGDKDGFQDHRRGQLPANDANCVAVADFNCDGLPDIFIGAYDSRLSRELDSHIYWQHSQDGFTRDNRSYLRTEAACGVVVADFNRDGYPDMAIVNHKVNTRHMAYSQVWYNNRGKFSSENTVRLPTSGPHGMINTPWQNIKDCGSVEEYFSSIYQRQSPAENLTCTIAAQTPAGTSVKMAVRSADSEAELAKQPFVEVTPGQTLPLKKLPGQYLQYRLQLIAPDAVNTPQVAKVLVKFQ